ncbi:hypothetical protein C6502_00585 [Candidatus Poribacteria bacterium]|nr:MAG: hypothetical protein C6502_00585 [Candidatus Poribacteria bacterium]
MINSKQFQTTVHRFIELYGDRTEGIGEEIHAGLAWIDETKFVLIGGADTTTPQPPSWRRISRLLDLAQQLNRPLLLWDPPFQTDITGPTTLLHRSAVQNSQLQLLKLPVPIIGVFEALALEPNFAPIDAAVLVQPGEAGPQLETSPVLVKVAADSAGLKSEILELIGHLSTLPVERLVDQRLNSLRQAAGSGH